MKLYQAGYFRLGRQGSDAGWSIVAPSAGMSQIAKEGFKGIGASLVTLKQKMNVPVKVMGFFRHDRFFYWMHVNYAASGEDHRGVAYVHGYCFNQKDYYAMCSRPEMLFGAQPDTFDQEYRPEITAYPVRESVSFRKMDDQRLMEKYGFSKEEYRELILGAICALEGYGDPMCLKCNVPGEQYLQIYQEIMYLIMKGLPYHLRHKLLSFSFRGMQSTLYFSDTVLGNNYVDLDERVFQCDYSRLKKYDFIDLYSSFVLRENREREIVLEEMRQFNQAVFVDPLEDAGCVQVEAGYQAKEATRFVGIASEKAVGLLQDFLHLRVNKEEETAEYLAELLKVINQNEVKCEDLTLLSELERMCNELRNDRLSDQYALFCARRILEKNGTEGIRLLEEMRADASQKSRYQSICAHLEERGWKYCVEYQMEEILSRKDNVLEEVYHLLKNQREILSSEEYGQILQTLYKAIQKEMQNADGFDKLYEITERMKRILKLRPEKYVVQQKEDERKLFCMVWNAFDVKWFDVNCMDEYRECGVEEAAWEDERNSCPHATQVWKLMSIFEAGREQITAKQVYPVLMSDEVIADAGIKYSIRMKLEKYCCYGREITSEGLDLLLLLSYHPKKEQFELIRWLHNVDLCMGKDTFKTLTFQEFIEESWLLEDDELKKKFIRDLKEVLRTRNKEIKRNKKITDKEIKEKKKVLKEISQCLKGKGKKGKEDWEEKRPEWECVCKEDRGRFLYSLHKAVVGSFVLLSLGIGDVCIWRYGSEDRMLPILFAVGILAVLGLLIVLRVKEDGGVKNMCVSMGIDSVRHLLLYLGIPLSLIVVVVAAFLIGGFLTGVVSIIIFLVLAATEVIAYGVFAKE